MENSYEPVVYEEQPVAAPVEDKKGWSTGALIGTGIAGVVIGGIAGYCVSSWAAQEAQTEARLAARDELKAELERINCALNGGNPIANNAQLA